ncbi:glycoside hydrolase family 36 protein [Paenibacillus sp. FSL L8-0340]|uniref:glycoside hydrolase family 36 protein n=1 Tax=Paenibacillus sp. FSL L8-0340 TaxID=2954685 RepID=UPI0031582786
MELLSEDEGASVIRFVMDSDQPQDPSDIVISWRHPAVDVAGYWDPGVNRERGLRVDFNEPFLSKATSLAPVAVLYNALGRNKLTFALSDALNPVKIRVGIHEESAEFDVMVELFTEACSPIAHYEVMLRIDTRERFYSECLKEVGEWWSSQPGYAPSAVPEEARLPMYSTWYSFHQQLVPEQILQQCRLAKSLGCEAVIIDDGWHTSNSERGYAYCGDWQVSSERIADMKELVAKVHGLGMKFLLWYSVPFVGIHSKAWNSFEGMFMNRYEDGTAVLDPRYPEVREYLIGIYEQALQQWAIDGFKLDFVDSFNLSEEQKNSHGGGRDYDSVPEAVDRLLTDTMFRLRAMKPDIMIEFRQKYIGPLMRKYGNIFRVGDCPNNYSQNRIGSIDIRLLCGNTAVHSDMMMWNGKDEPKNVALQFIHALFSVPQVSVLFDQLPDEHVAVTRFWLGFWREHRNLLLDGTLMPTAPDLLYPVIYAYNEKQWLAAVYSDALVRISFKVEQYYYIVNGTPSDQVTIIVDHEIEARLIVRNCQGEIVNEQQTLLNRGVHLIPVPPSGLIKLQLG